MQNLQTEPINSDWAIHKLGSLCDIKTGKKDVNAENQNGKYPFFTCAQEAHKIDVFSFDTEAVLVAGNGFFNVKYYSGKFDAYQRTYVLCNFKDNVDGKYIYHYVNSKLGEITKDNRGSTIRYIRLGDLTEQDVVLPTYSIQKQVVNKIESLLEKINTSSINILRSKIIIHNFRQSVLLAAVSGKLTEGWRAKNSLPTDYSDDGYPVKWGLEKLVSLVDSFQNGLSKRNSNIGTETVVLRLADYSGFQLGEDNYRKIKLTDKEIDKYKLTKDDLLIIRVNGSPDIVGRFFVFDEEREFTYCDHFIRIKIKLDKILPRYLELVANSYLSRKHIQDNMVSSAGQNTVNQTTIGGLNIPLPSIDEQQEIINRFVLLSNVADSIENNIQKSGINIDKLSQSILFKAFKGELVS